MTAGTYLRLYGFTDQMTFDSELGGIVSVAELREKHWPEVLAQDELSAEEYPFEVYLYDCLAENGGALHLRGVIL